MELECAGLPMTIDIYLLLSTGNGLTTNLSPRSPRDAEQLTNTNLVTHSCNLSLLCELEGHFVFLLPIFVPSFLVNTSKALESDDSTCIVHS